MLGSIALLLLILVIAATSYYLGKRETPRTLSESPIPIIQASEITGQQVLGVQTFSWQGIVAGIEDSVVSFSTSVKSADGSISTRQVSALIEPSTELYRWDLTQLPQPDEPVSNKNSIGIDEIKPGQQVVVKAANNIDAENEVTASSITLLITPEKL